MFQSGMRPSKLIPVQYIMLYVEYSCIFSRYMKVIFISLLLISFMERSAAGSPPDDPASNNALSTGLVIEDSSDRSLPNVGIVVSTIQIPNYTYIELLKDDMNIWLAAPKITLDKAVKIRYGKAIPMVNFYSNRLRREFPEIFFVERVEVVE